jgi:hypothetical protein
LLTEPDCEPAIASAIAFLAGSREPFALLWLDVMHRRFGIAPFADALRRFDRVLAERPKELPLLRVFRRMADRDNPLRLEDMDAVTHPSDRLVVCALYCDRLRLSPSFFTEMLDKAANAGGYYLTHALLAVIWMREYGGGSELPAAFLENLYRASAALVGADAGTVSDLQLEAAAFLHLAGQGARVDRTFIDSVLGTQQRDGGWGRSRDGRSDWHATILALLLLLHVQARSPHSRSAT